MVRVSFEDLMEMISVNDELIVITRDLRVMELRGPHELGMMEHVFGRTKDRRISWVMNRDGTVEVRKE